MADTSTDALFGAAILKLTFRRKNLLDTPGFTFVYNGTLRELGVTDAEVERYIDVHRDELIAHLEKDQAKKAGKV